MNARELFPDTKPTLYDVIDAMTAGFLRTDQRFDRVDAEFVEMKQEMGGIKQRLFKIELKLEDKSDTVQNHEERLVSLEGWKKAMGRKGMAGA